MYDEGSELRERDRALLEFERDWQAHRGGKERAVRARFGISPARYYQLLWRVVDDPAADSHDPLTVRRLRRRREERVRRRTEQALGRSPGR